MSKKQEIIIAGGKENTRKAIIAIGEDLIRRANDITNDLKYVASITISSKIEGGEIVNFDVNKDYVATIEEDEKKTVQLGTMRNKDVER